MADKFFDILQVFASDKSDDEGLSIESLEFSGEMMFVGSSKGDIVVYTVSSSEDQYATFTIAELVRTSFPGLRPIQYLKFASALNLLFCLTDGILCCLRLDDMQFEDNLKVHSSVTCFAFNESPMSKDAFTLEIAVGTTRREIVLLEYVPETDSFKKKMRFDTEDIALAMVYNGTVICYGTKNNYFVLDVTSRGTKRTLDLQTYESLTPIVKRISKNEYLINCTPQNLGIFIDNHGNATQRAPLSWSSKVVLSIAVFDNYVLCMGTQVVSVYSIDDQTMKQQLFFRDGRSIDNYEGRIYLSTNKNIFQLQQTPWPVQANQLLHERRVDEALALLAENSCNTSHCFTKIVRELKLHAGYLKCQESDFETARTLFVEEQLDPNQLICMYADWSSHFVSPTEILHLKFDVQPLNKDNRELYERSLNFLQEYLQEIRNEAWANEYLQVIDTHMLKILVELRDSNGIVNFLSKKLPNNKSPLIIDESDIKSFCATSGRQRELAIFHWFYISHGRSEAVKILIGLCETESAVELKFLFGFLQRFNSSFDTLLPHLDWFFKADSNETLALLSCCKDDVNVICDCLKSNEYLLLKFLEVLLIERKFEREDLHLRLYKLYFKQLLSGEFDDKEWPLFRLFLLTSKYYPVLNLLSLIEENHPKMLHEIAILRLKLGEYEKAMDVLVNQLEDCRAAEEYVANMPDEIRQDVLRSLLKIYLSRGKNDVLWSRAVDLLNSGRFQADTAEIIKLLPESWTINEVKDFLIKGLKYNQKRTKEVRLVAALVKSNNCRLIMEKAAMSMRHFTITDDKLCPKCNQLFVDPQCVLYPDGKILHEICAPPQSIR